MQAQSRVSVRVQCSVRFSYTRKSQCFFPVVQSEQFQRINLLRSLGDEMVVGDLNAGPWRLRCIGLARSSHSSFSGLLCIRCAIWFGRRSFMKRMLADVERNNGQLKEHVTTLEETNLRWEVGLRSVAIFSPVYHLPYSSVPLYFAQLHAAVLLGCTFPVKRFQ